MTIACSGVAPGSVRLTWSPGRRARVAEIKSPSTRQWHKRFGLVNQLPGRLQVGLHSIVTLYLHLYLQHTALRPMSASTTTSSQEPTQRRFKTRPTSSAVLWGHLLSNNDVSRSTSSSRHAEGPSATALSTMTPVDKTGTSLRILLHDTQANLEKFSERVGKLTGDIDESKREIGTTKALLQQDHEKTVEEIVDLGE